MSIFKRKEDKKDYQIYRKKIYKGKMAHKGTLFLEIKVRTITGKRASCVRQILGGRGLEHESKICKEMRAKVKKELGF